MPTEGVKKISFHLVRSSQLFFWHKGGPKLVIKPSFIFIPIFCSRFAYIFSLVYWTRTWIIVVLAQEMLEHVRNCSSSNFKSNPSQLHGKQGRNERRIHNHILLINKSIKLWQRTFVSRIVQRVKYLSRTLAKNFCFQNCPESKVSLKNFGKELLFSELSRE